MMTRDTQPGRVLIIDDDVMSRDVLNLLLATEGWAVSSVPSGEAALAEVGKSHAPDVILTDMQMPGLSGAELGEQLRRACPPTTLLFAISGSKPPAGTAKSFDHFLLKPFHVSQFAEAVELCRKRSVPKRDNQKSTSVVPPIPSAVPTASNLPMTARVHDPLPPSSPASPQALTPATPELDERIYNQLHDALPRLQLRQIYSLCVKDVRKRIASMRSLAAHHDSEEFVREAHAIKGGCGMLGASELYQLAAGLEKSGLQSAGLGSPGNVNPLDELAAACDRLERILGTRT